jgi:class 3 adenylate cyclase
MAIPNIIRQVFRTSSMSLVGLLLLNFFYPRINLAQNSPSNHVNDLWQEYKQAGSDSLKIEKLSELAFFYYDFIYDKEIADSLSDVAIRIAEMSYRPGLLLLAYNLYIESNDIDANYQKVLGYANKAVQLCNVISSPELEWRTWKNLADVYISNFDYNRAYDCSIKAVGLANALGDNSLKIASYLTIGKCLEGKNQKIDAFRNYLVATDLAEKTKDSEMLRKCYSQLSKFYSMNKMYDKAILYKLREGDIIKGIIPIDSVSLMWTQYSLQEIEVGSDNVLNERSILDLLNYAIKTRNNRLRYYEFAIYRRHLIEANKIDVLYDLYNNKYPQELKKLSFEDPALYYRLKAFFCEEQNKPDSAEYYFNKVEKLLISDQNKIYRSNFYLRFGQFLVRQHRYKEAIAKFHLSYQIAKEASSYFPYMLGASSQLEKIYATLGDYKKAYSYSVLNRVLKDSISNISKKEQLIMLDINREKQQRDHAAELEKQRIERTVRQRKAERNMMAGGVGFLIVLSLLIFRNYRNQKRSNKLLDAAKKKSEDLLLNILPFETAEELKVHGSAKAKRFEEVTVMFTDFKDFTLASEKMSAEELVKLVHFYYSEFDWIISKYNLEKIKIIGDSYMCAGGLPVSNKTHAHDVVSAALELQEFMSSQKTDRVNLGESYFELRIGIHSGPVVAGIVGTKKFAYDIWGDTVNTASRMENSCETGKVNISGTTYERVKDRFKCTYRGKILAKNKGEIDMYFVESPFVRKPGTSKYESDLVV